MTDLNRREFLRYSADAAGRAVAGFAALNAIISAPPAWGRSGRPPAAQDGEGGYGKLLRAGPDLALPKGFSYRVIGVEGSMMSDGYATPGRHDGMGAFSLPNGNILLIRNHERDDHPAPGIAMGEEAAAYDPGGAAGTVSLEVHPETREVIRDFVSLNGTYRNCAGGATPWGSWLSCEEAFFGPESGFGEYHGYIFEVPVTRQRAERTEPLVAMGRFVHEAVAVDPQTGIVYETEDHFKAGFYRFLPNAPYRDGLPGDLRAGGRLQVLAVRGRPRYDTSKGQRVGATLPVTWVDIPDCNPLVGPAEFGTVFEQGFSAGGARFSRLEGCFYGDGNVYFVATDGGDKELGQVWQYRPTGPDEGALTLVFESRSRGVLKRPDNICVSPRGAIILCEDANMGRHYVRGLTRDGKVFDIAANIRNDSELAGAVFSPDGRTLFFNVLGGGRKRSKGMTLAVWGPWENGAV
jgi:hypothetical protein